VLTEVEKHMTATPELLKALVEAELNLLSDGRVLTHIRSLLVPAKPVLRLWDYGSDGEQFRCWTVLEHPASNTGIAYCENGFGPRSPWGLVHLEGSKDQTSIGMDAGWFTTFLQVYFESQAVSELPIWRVEKTDALRRRHFLTCEGGWDETWAQIMSLRESDPANRYGIAHSIQYERE
jgi:hypothetical protein